jgi:hypothetical protein
LLVAEIITGHHDAELLAAMQVKIEQDADPEIALDDAAALVEQLKELYRVKAEQWIADIELKADEDARAQRDKDSEARLQVIAKNFVQYKQKLTMDQLRTKYSLTGSEMRRLKQLISAFDLYLNQNKQSTKRR